MERVLDEIQAALAQGASVVALESTLITHGLLHPLNLDTALAAEQAVREGGAVPATIAILDGCVRIGLQHAELERLARAADVVKASRRDLGVATARGMTAGTTVAATAFLAQRAGIKFFATGGIGGVHRGADTSFDVSADLHELARTPLAVICAGAKSILDLPGTLEMLETLGVPVLGYRTDTFPAFYVASSGLPLEHRIEDAATVATILKRHWELAGKGVLIAQPAPADLALGDQELQQALATAETEAARQGMRGKEVTPFLLAQLAERTGGRSLEVNQALIVANARLAAEIARIYHGQSRNA